MQACKLIPLMYGLFVRLLYSVCYETQAVSVDYLHQGLRRSDSYAGVPSKVSWRCEIANRERLTVMSLVLRDEWSQVDTSWLLS